MSIPEVSTIYAPAVDPNGLIFVAASTNAGTEGWVGAWTLDGESQWWHSIDPVAFGLDDDDGTARDIDVLDDGDALLSYRYAGDEHFAVFARLDADTGDVAWSTNLGDVELEPLDPAFGISGGEASNAAVSASGRVFAHGVAYGAFGEPVFVAELDESDGTVEWLTEVSYLDIGVNGYGSHAFLADDDSGLYRAYGISYLGPYSSSGLARLSLDGTYQNGIGPGDIPADGESVGCGQYAIGPDGNLALSCSWSNNDKGPPTETIAFLERRSPDNTLLVGGQGDSPDIYGALAFEADGDLITVSSWIYQLDPDLVILSADDIDGDASGVVVLPNDDLIIGGRRDGEGFLARYASCAE